LLCSAKHITNFAVNQIANYLGLIRFSHTLFALPFVILAAGMALKLNLLQTPPVSFHLFDAVGILLCMVFARSAAMGFNRFADRKIDAENPRTARRHLPAGIVSVGGVITFVALCSAGFVVSTLLFLPNRIPLIASVPVLLFLFGYSYTKRWTVAAHFWLGTSLALAPLAAWMVIRPVLLPIPLPPLMLGIAVLFWTAGFDLIYATQDTEFDRSRGLFSVPGKYGIAATFRLSAVCHIISVLFFASIPFVYEPFGRWFGFGVAFVTVILAAEHWIAAPRKNQPIDLDRINVACFQMNIVISCLLLILGLFDLC
jgi:4-hydroxybenzoate polyprenyltransferase